MGLFLVACGAGGSTKLPPTSPAPTITSADSAVFSVGTGGSFTVTTTGTPIPTITETGAPATFTWHDNSNGTGTLSGTPTTSGTFSVTFTASNGVGTSAVQTFTLIVAQASNLILPITNGLTLATASSHWVLVDNCQVAGGIVPMNQFAFELTYSDAGFKANFIDPNGASHTSTGTWTANADSSGLLSTLLVTTAQPITNPGMYPTSWTVSSMDSVTGSTLSSQSAAIVNWYTANSAAFLTSPGIAGSTEGCSFTLAGGGI
jgi:methionine-rich copper-binding protein CopC